MLFHNTKWTNRRPPKIMSVEHTQCAIGHRKNGMQYKDIARLLNVPIPRVVRAVVQEGHARRYHNIPDGKVEEVQQYVLIGLSQQAIADIYDVSMSSVVRYMHKHDIIPANPQVLSDLDFPVIREMWESGLTQQQIGDAYGCAQSAISKCMIRNGLLLMNRSTKIS